LKNLLFIPCYNDEKNCSKLLLEIEKLKKKNFDVLIINDGSKKFLNFKSKFIKITIINLQNNFGIGHCIKMAIKYALKNGYSKFCRIDSDGEHNPFYIKDIFNKLSKKNFLIGQRNIFYREQTLKFLSKRFLNLCINSIFNLKLNDFNCGMMGFDIKAMKIISKQRLINYPEPQLIIDLCNKKLDYDLININQRKRFYGNSSIHFFRGIDFMLVTIIFIFHYLINKHD